MIETIPTAQYNITTYSVVKVTVENKLLVLFDTLADFVVGFVGHTIIVTFKLHRD